jgi:hypothetical protein
MVPFLQQVLSQQDAIHPVLQGALLHSSTHHSYIGIGLMSSLTMMRIGTTCKLIGSYATYWVRNQPLIEVAAPSFLPNTSLVRSSQGMI